MTCRIPMSRATTLVVALAATALAGCPASPTNPCADKTCPEGFVCVVSGADAACAPPADPCGKNNPCVADQICVIASDGRSACLTPDRCRGATCAVGKGCDQATGQCTKDRAPCDGISCPAGQACNPATEACEAKDNKCHRVCCDNTHVCDPDSGSCVPDQCLDAAIACKCGPSQVCNPVNGNCDAAATACGACEAGEYCDRQVGACVAIVRGTPAAGEIGAACGTAADCTRAGTEGFCLTDGGLFGTMPGGSCSASCDRSACPGGKGCVDVGLKICLDICLDKKDCREGYGCVQLTTADPRHYCFPEGASGSKCTGPDCQPIGGACQKDEECMAGAECSKNLPGGYCQKRNCKASDCDEARENCWCLTADKCTGATIGLAKCDTRLQNCRPGYACNPVTNDNLSGYCYPRNCEDDADCRPAGTGCENHCDAARGFCDVPCARNDDCIGGRSCDVASGRCFQACRTATANCGPDAFCDVQAQKCTRKCRSDAMCGASQFCDRVSGKCTARCTTDASCTAAQFCDGSGHCRAKCGGDDDCGTNEYCEAGSCNLRCSSTSGCTFGQFCETVSGRCRHDLKTTLVGKACSRDGDCGAYNASCLTNGFPGGYCVAPGCSATEPCGPGAACVTANGGSRCMHQCEGDVDCRPLYYCANRGSVKVCEVD